MLISTVHKICWFLRVFFHICGVNIFHNFGVNVFFLIVEMNNFPVINHYDITEILLKVLLNTIKQTNNQSSEKT